MWRWKATQIDISRFTHSYSTATTPPCSTNAASTQHGITRYRVAQRRSVIVALALAAGCNAFVAPHPAAGKALRAAAIEEEPEAPKYPTVNGWTADESKFMAGLPGALPPMGNFDPAGFTEGKSVAELKMLREAEVTHGRVSMLASLGFLVQESFHPLFRLGDKDIGPAIRHLDEVRAEVPIFFEILVLGIGFAEISRSLAGWTAPAGSNPADGPLANLPDDTPFRRLEDKYYPGDIGFDPAGLKPSDPKEFAEMATKELQNGRLAMIAVAGFFLQELVNGKGIIENFSS